MSQQACAVAIAVFGMVFCGGFLLLPLFNTYQRQVDERLKGIPQQGSRRQMLTSSPVEPTAESFSVVKTAATRLIPVGKEDRQRYQVRFLQAGIYHPAAVSLLFLAKACFVLLPLITCLILGWMGRVSVGIAVLSAGISAGVGLLAPSFWLESKVRRRHRLLRCSLADCLDLMIVCLESGLSLQATVQKVSDELAVAHPILAGELKVVQRDIDLGASVPAGFRRLADRSGLEELRTLTTFIRESQRIGTPLTEALRSHADMLRNQREQAAEESAQKAAIRILIPTMLLIMPAVFVVLAGPAWIQIQQAFAEQ